MSAVIPPLKQQKSPSKMLSFKIDTNSDTQTSYISVDNKKVGDQEPDSEIDLEIDIDIQQNANIDSLKSVGKISFFSLMSLI